MGEGFVAIDVDPRGGGSASLRRLLRGRALPATAEAVTGGGGRHYVFKTDRPVRSRCGLLPGIDLIATGRFLVAEPSRHPSGSEYAWVRSLAQGIARLPGWLEEFLEAEGLIGPEEPPPARTPARPRRRRAATATAAECRDLARDAIARYPVERRGQRNDQMVRVLGMVLTRGLAPDVAAEVAARWWDRFHRLGRIATPHPRRDRLIADAIRSITSSEHFAPAPTPDDHLAACLALATPLPCAPTGTGPVPPENRRGLTSAPDRPAWATPAERAYVEAVIALVLHEARRGRASTFPMTDDQVKAIAHARDPAIAWGPQQVERLKRKYISRPGKPATRLELLVEVEKGGKRPGQRAGRPSTYRVTGAAAWAAGDAGDMPNLIDSSVPPTTESRAFPPTTRRPETRPTPAGGLFFPGPGISHPATSIPLNPR